MNKINIFLVALIFSMVTISCTKDFEEINTYKNCEINGTIPNLLANYHFNQGVGGAINAAVTSVC